MKDYSETAAGKCLTIFRRNQLKPYLTPYTITMLGELKRKSVIEELDVNCFKARMIQGNFNLVYE